MLSSCSKDEIMPVPVPGGEGEVAFELNSPDFALPLTRATDTDITELYAIVFSGSGNSATFVEVKSKTGSGTLWTLPLTARTGDCMILLIANPNGFYEGTDAIPDLGVWLSGLTLAQVCSNLRTGLLLTRPVTPPFGTTPLPMSAVIARTAAAGAQGITVGSTINAELVRSVAKVTVTHNSITDFKVLGIERVYNTADQGIYHRLGTSVTTVGANTDYIDGANLISPSVQAGNGTGTTAATPIYLYERPGSSSSTIGAFIIIRAEYRSKIGYYKLNFRNDAGTVLPITRNTNYIMNITHADSPGYPNIADAINSDNPLLEYKVTAVDLSSHDIYHTAYYYIGFSTSNIRLYYPPISSGSLTLPAAFEITTNSKSAFTSGTNSITASTGITVSPTVVSANSTTPINVTINSSFPGTGTIVVKFGMVEHTITIDQTNTFFHSAGGMMPFSGVHSAQIIPGTPTNQFYFTPDGVTPVTTEQWNAATQSVQSYNGTVYVHASSLPGSATRMLMFYGSYLNTSGSTPIFTGRTKYIIFQNND